MSAPSKGNMRDAMPLTAEWVDELREAFGAETINPQLRSMHACENGKTIGQQTPYKHAVAVSGMPDIVALMETRKPAVIAYKQAGKWKR